jgi:ribosomal protein S18 acetylase RimI-like enzyme
VKARCFQDELDAIIFPCLGDHRGCQRLMREIRRKPGFSPAATWLLAGTTGSPVGTIQGVVDVSSLGSIQNVGVIPTERGQGLGRALVCQALRGFRDSGVSRVYLEVTAENDPAVRLYRSLGFSKARTLYRSLEQD